MERKRKIASYGCEVFITNRDSTEATSMVCGTRRCQQLCKERSAAFFPHTYLGDWPNIECVYAWVFFPTVLFGILPKRVYMVALSTRFETDTLLKLGFQAPNASEPTEAKTQQIRGVGLQLNKVRARKHKCAWLGNRHDACQH